MKKRTLLCVVVAATVFISGYVAISTAEVQPASRWYKGNTHPHSLWSDGNEFPEMIVDWYKSQDYDFLAISDHNIVSVGE